MPATTEAVTVNKLGTELQVGSNKKGLATIFNLDDDAQIAQFDGYTFPCRILPTQDQKYAVVLDYQIGRAHV